MRKVLVLSSLLFVIGCAAFNYRFYGVDTADVPASSLKRVRLIAGLRSDTDKTLADFQSKDEDEIPRAVLMPYSEFLKARQEIVDCRAK